MLEHQRAMRQRQRHLQMASRRVINIPSKSAAGISDKLSKLHALAQTLSSDSIVSTLEQETASSEDDDHNTEALDVAAVDDEMKRWDSLGVITHPQQLEEFDLVSFWRVSGVPILRFRLG